MTQPNQYRIYAKAIRVIDSCTSPDHLSVCRKFVELAYANLSRIGTPFCGEARWDLHARLSSKEAELRPSRKDATIGMQGTNWEYLKLMQAQQQANHLLDLAR